VQTAGIRLRSYRAEDVDAMHALDVVCFERPFRFTRGAMRRFAEANHARVVIAEVDDALAGFVIVQAEEDEEVRTGYVVTLDVEPAFRRRGIAGVLMSEVERLARLDGCDAMVLHGFTGNDAAIRFYANAGFVRSDRVEGFYAPGVDAWVYSKRLPPTVE
jgi:ribosomal-protein-alanine N-acetyltransferase